MGHKKDDCKECVLKCGRRVELEVDAKPKIECHELWRKNTEFDFGVELKVSPKCRLVPINKCHDNKDPCKVNCDFKVNLDFDCKSKVLNNKCGDKPRAEYEVNVAIPVKPHCKPGANLCESESSKQVSSVSSSSCTPKSEKKHHRREKKHHRHHKLY